MWLSSCCHFPFMWMRSLSPSVLCFGTSGYRVMNWQGRVRKGSTTAHTCPHWVQSWISRILFSYRLRTYFRICWLLIKSQKNFSLLRVMSNKKIILDMISFGTFMFTSWECWVSWDSSEVQAGFANSKMKLYFNRETFFMYGFIKT